MEKYVSNLTLFGTQTLINCWLDLTFKESSWNSIKIFNQNKDYMLYLLINKKLTFMEEEYA